MINLSRPIFGAPPLLNKKMQQNNFDAILTYWPYQAKLLTDSNFQKVININEILNELGLHDLPILAVAKGKNRNAGEEKIYHKNKESLDALKDMVFDKKTKKEAKMLEEDNIKDLGN